MISNARKIQEFDGLRNALSRNTKTIKKLEYEILEDKTRINELENFLREMRDWPLDANEYLNIYWRNKINNFLNGGK